MMQPLSKQIALFGIDIVGNVVGNMISDIPKQELYRALQAASVQIEDSNRKQDEILKILKGR